MDEWVKYLIGTIGGVLLASVGYLLTKKYDHIEKREEKDDEEEKQEKEKLAKQYAEFVELRAKCFEYFLKINRIHDRNKELSTEMSDMELQISKELAAAELKLSLQLSETIGQMNTKLAKIEAFIK